MTVAFARTAFPRHNQRIPSSERIESPPPRVGTCPCLPLPRCQSPAPDHSPPRQASPRSFVTQQFVPPSATHTSAPANGSRVVFFHPSPRTQATAPLYLSSATARAARTQNHWPSSSEFVRLSRSHLAPRWTSI